MSLRELLFGEFIDDEDRDIPDIIKRTMPGPVASSSCPHCGAPIFLQSPWHGVVPPPAQYTCSCIRPTQKSKWTTGSDTDGTK